MTFQQIASQIALAEGKKSQTRIGDIREILRLIVTMELQAVKDGKLGPLESLKIIASQKFAKRK